MKTKSFDQALAECAADPKKYMADLILFQDGLMEKFPNPHECAGNQVLVDGMCHVIAMNAVVIAWATEKLSEFGVAV